MTDLDRMAAWPSRPDADVGVPREFVVTSYVEACRFSLELAACWIAEDEQALRRAILSAMVQPPEPVELPSPHPQPRWFRWLMLGIVAALAASWAWRAVR